LYDLFDLANKILASHPSNCFYSIAGVNRLILFFIFVQQLSCRNQSQKLYKILFTGILTGTFFSIVIGLGNYYSLISLADYRNLDPLINPNNIQYRLQSTFGHPGWFAEFVTITIPIILVGFFKKNRNKLVTLLLFSALLLCEIALILAKARAGWISYPLTLFFCWLFYHNNSKNGSFFSWKKNKAIILKVCISIPITILLSFLIVSQFIGESNSQIPKKELSKKENYRIKHNSLHTRMASLFRVEDRLYLWEDGIRVGEESPIWGMGYESFNWQAHILKNIPVSKFSKTRQLKKIYDTPHNLYVQLFVSNGIIGLLVWCFLIGSMIYFLINDFIAAKEPFHLVVILSTISFHIYGIFQSLQYIPCIWLLIFLNFGYTVAAEKNIAPSKRADKTNLIAMICYITIACSGLVFYVSNTGSKKIYQKYDTTSITVLNHYIGFYAPENWSGKIFRWTAAKAIINFQKPGKVKLTLYCRHPDIGQHPVTVTLKTNTKELEQITFTKVRFLIKEYSIPFSDNQFKLYINVSRTWTPKETGVNEDTRKLGIAISEEAYNSEISPHKKTGGNLRGKKPQL